MGVNLQEVYFEKKTISPHRGRNNTLIQRRDYKLAARFYYYSTLQKKNYYDTLQTLHSEFDLTERSIIDRLRACQDILDAIFAEKPSVNELRRKISYMVWN